MLSDDALDIIFRHARTHNGWQDKPVSDELLRELYDLVKMGPTSANCFPGRITFVKTREAKDRLSPALSGGNRDKTMAAPVTAILAYDMEFYDRLDFLFPHGDAKPWFTTSDSMVEETAFRNGTLQGAYLIIAARALGLDTGPMSGFDNAKVDEEFFAGTAIKSNFICSLGYGDPSKIFDRLPRFDFDEVCEII